MHALSERLSERCQRGVVKYTLVCVKMPIFASILLNSNLGLKWKQTAERENTCNSILDPGQFLKWQQSNIPALMLLKQQKRENL